MSREIERRMHVYRYTAADSARWDEMVARCPMATFLHSRRYLSYHGDRFRDVSVFITDHKGRPVGAFPAAIDPQDANKVISHPGITYGGILHDGSLRGEKMLQALECLSAYYRSESFDAVQYKAVPAIYHLSPSADDLYALFRSGAERYRCDLSCAIDLGHRQPISQRRRRGLKKSIESGVQVSDSPSFAVPYWRVVEDNLKRKFNLDPVHSIEEISGLHALFSEDIRFVVAHLNSEVVAGIVLFMTPRVVHVQYTASSQSGQEVGALDAVFEYSIERAIARGARYFNFGISTEKQGQHLNASLYQYKSEFGAGGVLHEFYEIDLKV